MFKRSSILAIAIASALVVIVPFGRLALARVSVIVTCCCGEHEAGEACGCLDCPSAVGHAKQERDDRGPRAPEIRSCRTEFELGKPPLDAPFTLPLGLDIPHGKASPAPPAADSGPEDRALDPPPRPS